MAPEPLLRAAAVLRAVLLAHGQSEAARDLGGLSGLGGVSLGCVAGGGASTRRAATSKLSEYRPIRREFPSPLANHS